MPLPSVEELKGAIHSTNADTVLAVGGGSAIGVCKAAALRSEHPVLVVAVPTTYSGSEMTNIYGITAEGTKTTGRSEKVRPGVVIYDPTLLAKLPASIAVPSLFNGLAHCVEALWDATCDPLVAMAAEEGVRAITQSVQQLAKADDATAAADHEAAVDQALYGAFLAGKSLGASMGVHHKVCCCRSRRRRRRRRRCCSTSRMKCCCRLQTP